MVGLMEPERDWTYSLPSVNFQPSRNGQALVSNITDCGRCTDLPPIYGSMKRLKCNHGRLLRGGDIQASPWRLKRSSPITQCGSSTRKSRSEWRHDWLNEWKTQYEKILLRKICLRKRGQCDFVRPLKTSGGVYGCTCDYMHYWQCNFR